MIEVHRMTLLTGYDMVAIEPSPVMPGLVPGIHVFLSLQRKGVDGRNKSGHDD
jgi:hypothetical protein